MLLFVQHPHEDDDPITPQVVAADEPEDDGAFVREPSKLIRIASMTRAMLEEVRQAPLDDADRHRLVAIYKNSLLELKDVLSDELKSELDAMFIPLETEIPSESELRIAQAQLVGWLEGLFSGIQASLWSQQMLAAKQLEEMRRRQALQAGNEPDPTGHYL